MSGMEPMSRLRSYQNSFRHGILARLCSKRMSIISNYRALRISASVDLTICGNELKLIIRLAKFNSSFNMTRLERKNQKSLLESRPVQTTKICWSKWSALDSKLPDWNLTNLLMD